jgi:hypothetical protein
VPEFSGGTEKNNDKLRIAVVLAEISDRHLSNASQELYCYASPPGMKNEEYTLLFLFICQISYYFSGKLIEEF